MSTLSRSERAARAINEHLAYVGKDRTDMEYLARTIESHTRAKELALALNAIGELAVAMSHYAAGCESVTDAYWLKSRARDIRDLAHNALGGAI